MSHIPKYNVCNSWALSQRNGDFVRRCDKATDNRKDQWNYKLRKDKINKPLARLTKKKRGLEIRNERGDTTTDTTKTKDHTKLLWTIIHQQTGQPRRNGYSPRNIQPTKTES